MEEYPTKQIEKLSNEVREHGNTLITIQDTLKSIDEKLKSLEPMADNYKTAVILGKWFLGLLIFLGALGTVLIECFKIFKK